MTATSPAGSGRGPTIPARRLTLVEPSPEQLLRQLFECEDQLLDSLHKCRVTQKAARLRYAAENGLKMLPSLETIRKVVGKK